MTAKNYRRTAIYRRTLSAIRASLDRLTAKHGITPVVSVREEHYQKRTYRLYAAHPDSGQELALYWSACPADGRAFLDQLAGDANAQSEDRS